MRASTFRIAASTSRDFGTRTFSAYRDARTGSHESSMTTTVGTPPARKLRTAPRPTASELRTTAHGLDIARSVRVLTRDVARQLAGHVFAPNDKPTERPERPGSRGSHEMEPRQRRLETDVQLGIALTRAQRLAQGGREERVPPATLAKEGPCDSAT